MVCYDLHATFEAKRDFGWWAVGRKLGLLLGAPTLEMVHSSSTWATTPSTKCLVTYRISFVQLSQFQLQRKAALAGKKRRRLGHCS